MLLALVHWLKNYFFNISVLFSSYFIKMYRYGFKQFSFDLNIPISTIMYSSSNDDINLRGSIVILII